MIVRHLNDCLVDRKIEDPNGNWNSVRMLLKDDGMGFSFHITTIYANSSMKMHYMNHLESVYCISGTGTIKDMKTNQEHKIEPGVIYALDQHDEHILTSHDEMQLACVFNPPITGTEVHNKLGAYELE
jgi:L-ectoine synthase